MSDFNRLLEEQIPRLRRYARALTRNIERADDLVQDTLIRALTKQHLWQAGVTYNHGTGHGVGAFLSVHEGPIGISTRYPTPFEAGMIVSDEPGYYKAGEYGIRIENLILTVEQDIAGAEKDMLGFETLTFAPYERALIEVPMLDAGEIAWIDGYHARVREIVGPQLAGDAADWLLRATAPLQSGMVR